MTAVRTLLLLAVGLPLCGRALAADPHKVTFEDDVLPIFRDHCLKCHNPDKLKGDLDLTSFGTALKGGGGGVDLNPGDPEGSQLYKSITRTDDPAMPPNATLPEKDVATIRAWIEGGLLQGLSSKALTVNKPAVNLALKTVSVGRPEGPPPMPGGLALDPFVRATRGTALSALAGSPWAPVVALTGAKQIIFYNTDNLDFIGILPFPDGFPCDVRFSRDGKLLVAAGGRGGKSGLVTVWDIVTGQRIITVGDQYDSVLAADISPDRKWIALGGPDRVLKIYNTKDGALEHRIKKHTDWLTALEFSPDGKYLASGDRNGGLVLWEPESGQELFTLNGHKAAITAVSWRSDSEMLLSASEDGTLKLWKPSDGTSLRNLPAHSGGALAASFARDGHIVSSGRDNKIQIWEVTGKRVASPAFNGDLPNRVVFSDDGRRVIGSDWRGKVYVWDAGNGKLVGELEDNPPTLTERVERGQKQLADLRAKRDEASRAHEKLEAELKTEQARLERSRSVVAELQAQLTTHEAAEKSAATDPARLSEARNKIKQTRADIAARQKESAVLGTQIAATTKKSVEAKAKANELGGQVDALSVSLQRWTAALQQAKANDEGKVSMR